MATTLSTIAQYLNNRNWKYRIEAERDRIITGVEAENVDHFLIVIQLHEKGEYVQFIAPKILEVKDHVFKGVLFQTMLAISYHTKMLRFEYDPNDGEIRATIEFPLEDTPLSEKQFSRALSGLIQLVDQTAMPRLQAVLATGTDPGHKQLAESLLDEMPEEMVNLLAQALMSRQQRGNV